MLCPPHPVLSELLCSTGFHHVLSPWGSEWPGLGSVCHHPPKRRDGQTRD